MNTFCKDCQHFFAHHDGFAECRQHLCDWATGEYGVDPNGETVDCRNKNRDGRCEDFLAGMRTHWLGQ